MYGIYIHTVSLVNVLLLLLITGQINQLIARAQGEGGEEKKVKTVHYS